MMKNRLIALFSCIVLLTSCLTVDKCNKLHPPCINKDSVITTIVTRDSVISIPPDSSMYYLYVACVDEYGKLTDNNVVLTKTIEQLKGDKAKVVIKPKSNNIVEVKCICDSVAIYAKLHDRYTHEFTASTQIIKENYVTGWQWFWIWCGRILMIMFAGVAVYLILKLAKKI